MHMTMMVTIPGDQASDPVTAFHQVSEALEPYDENLEVEPRMVWLDDNEVERATKYYQQNPLSIAEGGPGLLSDVPEGNLEAFNDWRARCVGCLESDGADSATYDETTGKIGYSVSYNDNGVWDWWQLGGRWNGFFMVKAGVSIGGEPVPEWRALMPGLPDRVEAVTKIPTIAKQHQAMLGTSGTFGDNPESNYEGRADLVRKGDIDLHMMRTLHRQQAEITYDKFEEVTQGLSIGETLETLKRRHFLLAGIPEDTNDYDWRALAALSDTERQRVHQAARQAVEEYHKQPWVFAIREANLLGMLGPNAHEAFDCTRVEFVERAEDGATSTYSLLHDGEFSEQDSLSDDRTDWARRQRVLLDSLPDDTWIAVVDYHS